MERLTIKNWRNLDPWETCGQDNYCKRGCHEQGGCAKGCIVPRIYDRLAVYEDTGLEPEEIRNALDVNDIIPEINVTVDHIRDLLQAEQDGRLVVLPCKVGDTVYAAETSPVIPLSVAYVGVYLDGADGGDWEALENIGKTVFLTSEEAEAALAGKGGEG